MTDTERKLLRILWSLHRDQEAYINIARLQRLSGRSEGQLRVALQRLAAEEYIQYDGLVVKVLRMPEEQVKREIRYWEYD